MRISLCYPQSPVIAQKHADNVKLNQTVSQLQAALADTQAQLRLKEEQCTALNCQLINQQISQLLDQVFYQALVAVARKVGDNNWASSLAALEYCRSQ